MYNQLKLIYTTISFTYPSNILPIMSKNQYQLQTSALQTTSACYLSTQIVMQQPQAQQSKFKIHNELLSSPGLSILCLHPPAHLFSYFCFLGEKLFEQPLFKLEGKTDGDKFAKFGMPPSSLLLGSPPCWVPPPLELVWATFAVLLVAGLHTSTLSNARGISFTKV
ncbi:hypothetical protein JTE90_007517 [Oedothorax gibbosus]|uniref:Uncharacterized protein n=1 Tax=Oedothorax gibbosus TaxID=931172 RepID=A0AAV6VL18_9ARAC|nr:hypothetical protein JTE90_007517 [Oedothorax gibbosus]